MLDARDQDQGIKSRSCSQYRQKGLITDSRDIEASASSREQHEATIEWNLLSGVQLRKETADSTEMGSVTIKGPTLFSHWCYKYSFGLTGVQQ